MTSLVDLFLMALSMVGAMNVSRSLIIGVKCPKSFFLLKGKSLRSSFHNNFSPIWKLSAYTSLGVWIGSVLLFLDLINRSLRKSLSYFALDRGQILSPILRNRQGFLMFWRQLLGLVQRWILGTLSRGWFSFYFFGLIQESLKVTRRAHPWRRTLPRLLWSHLFLKKEQTIKLEIWAKDQAKKNSFFPVLVSRLATSNSS